MKKVIIMLMGRSGSGKSYLEKKLLEKHPDEFHKVVSTTTRSPREGEVNGVHYHFVNEEAFDELDMVQTTFFDKHKYGSDLPQYTTDHRFVTLAAVPESVAKFKEVLKSKLPDALVVCVYFNINAKRLAENMQRRGDTDDMITDRLRNDNLDEQFMTSGLEADFIVNDTMLNENLPDVFYKWLQDNTLKTYIHAEDVTGRRIKKGDIITYPVRHASSMWMSKSIVYDIEYVQSNWRKEDEYRAVLKVLVPGPRWTWGEHKETLSNRKVVNWENAVILPIAFIHKFKDKKLQKLQELRKEILYHEDEKDSKR